MGSSIEVYGRRCVTGEEILSILRDLDLAVNVVGDCDLVQAMTGAGDWVYFEVYRPVTVDAVDLPPNLKLAAKELWLAVVGVNGYSDSNPAEAFCRRLADAMSGAMVYGDGDEVWPKRFQKTPAPTVTYVPARGLTLSWFGYWRGAQPVLPRLFVEQAQRSFGKPLIRRYGWAEPFENRFSDGGVDAMTEYWSLARDIIRFSCSLKSVYSGSMTTPDGGASASSMWSVTLYGNADHFVDQSLRDQLRVLFTGFADSSQAMFANAEVHSGYVWDGTQCLVPAGTAVKRHTHVWIQGRMFQKSTGLLGVTPYPTWWSWFGGGYAPLVARRLDHPPAKWRVTDTLNGRLVELSEQPATWAQLQNPLLRRLPVGWMPRALLSHHGWAARIRPRG